MNYLEIPYAYIGDTTNFVSPEKAPKGQVYRCPKCKTEVTLRRGKIRVPHFAHKSDTACSSESVVHKVAKQIICDGYNRSFKIRKPVMAIKRSCPDCGKVAYQKHRNDLPHLCHAATEVTLVDAGLKLDVGLYIAGELVGAIEVHNKNRVDEKRGDKFLEAKLPFIEVEAQDVIDEQERHWQVLIDYYHLRHTHKFKVFFCLNPINQNVSLLLPEIQGQIECPKCNKTPTM